jgi:hypothetical protein
MVSREVQNVKSWGHPGVRHNYSFRADFRHPSLRLLSKERDLPPYPSPEVCRIAECGELAVMESRHYDLHRFGIVDLILCVALIEG